MSLDFRKMVTPTGPEPVAKAWFCLRIMVD
jgi:hypothetical protein